MTKAIKITVMVSVMLTCHAHADSIRLIPKLNTDPQHCMDSVTQGYVSGFDGQAFEIYTVLSDCGQQSRVPAHCKPLIQAPDRVPSEINNAIVGSSSIFLRHIVQAEDVVSISFDRRVIPICKVGPLQKRDEIGPLIKPTTLQPITSGQVEQLTGADAIKLDAKVFTRDWLSALKSNPSIKGGETVILSGDLFSHTEKKPNDSIYLAGRRPTPGLSEEYYFVKGDIGKPTASGTPFKILQIVKVSSGSDQKLSPLSTTNSPHELKPVKIKYRKVKSGVFNWQGETSPYGAVKFRLLSITTKPERTVEIESESSIQGQSTILLLQRAY